MSKEENNKYIYTPLPEPIPITEQEWPDDVLPLVHTRTMAFNHENFIRECIEGLLMQKTTFPVQILIHDDASTDNTAAIIKEYEEKYPRLIKAYYQEENSYSKSRQNKKRLRKTYFSWTVGKYEAMCEGDDYWIDPLKLQKQVRFLEENPEYVLACGGYKSVNVYTNQEEVIIKKKRKRSNEMEGFEFGLDEMKKQWLTKTLTVVYRHSALKYYPSKKYQHGRDIHLFYHLLKVGKGYYFSSIMGGYHIHKGGINSMQPDKINFSISCKIYRELYDNNKDDYTRQRNIISSVNMFKYNIFNENNTSLLENIKIFMYAISLIKSVGDLKIIISLLLKKNKSSQYSD